METKLLSDFTIFNDEHLTKKIIYQDVHLLTFILNLNPGQTLPRHGHDDTTLTLQILAGAGTIAINDEPQPIVKNQLYILAGADILEVPLVSAPLSMLVNITPNPTNPIYRQPR